MLNVKQENVSVSEKSFDLTRLEIKPDFTITSLTEFIQWISSVSEKHKDKIRFDFEKPKNGEHL